MPKALLVAISMLALQANATSIVVKFSPDGDLFLGADGRNTGFTQENGKGVPRTSCKLKRFGSIIVGHVGGEHIVGYPDQGPPIVYFDTDPILGEAMKTKSGLEERPPDCTKLSGPYTATGSRGLPTPRNLETGSSGKAN